MKERRKNTHLLLFLVLETLVHAVKLIDEGRRCRERVLMHVDDRPKSGEREREKE